MKKLMAILLSLALVISFCGCVKQSGGDIRENDTKAETSGLSNGDADGNVADTNQSEDNDASTSTKEFSMGKISDTTYTSDFIGISYELDNGWTFYNEEQIKQLNNLTLEMAGDQVEELLKNADLVYDMFATDSNQLNNVNINLEKIHPLKLAIYDIVAGFNTTIPVLKESFGNMGYVNINSEIIKIEVDGAAVDALRTTAEISGANMYQVIFSKKCNGYLATITVTTYIEDTTADVIGNFMWIE